MDTHNADAASRGMREQRLVSLCMKFPDTEAMLYLRGTYDDNSPAVG